MDVDETKTSSGFERFLFDFTRLFALVGSIAALVGIVLLVSYLFFPTKKNYISLSDLDSIGKTEKTVAVPPKIMVQLPKNVRKYMSGSNEEVLKGWIGYLDYADQNDFVQNLSSVIHEAEMNLRDVIEVINKYKTVKLPALRTSEFEKGKRTVEKGAMIGAIFGLMLFVAMMSLVLVMLAVERNTRKIMNR